MVRKLLIILLLVNIGCINIYSQKGNETVILLQGKITDISGAPVNTSIQFISSKGKKSIIKTNSGDGGYQQVLTPAETYTVLAKDYIVISGNNNFTLPNPSEYMEIQRNFTVKKMKTGMELLKFDAFTPNSSTVSNPLSPALSELKELLALNQNMNILVTIHTHDSQFKPEKKQIKEEVTSKKKKAKTTTIIITADEQLRKFGEERIMAFKDHLRTYKIPERVVKFEIDTRPASLQEKVVIKPLPKSKKKKEKPEEPVSGSYSLPNVVITISKILDL